jgi:hypothetical protein
MMCCSVAGETPRLLAKAFKVTLESAHASARAIFSSVNARGRPYTDLRRPGRLGFGSATENQLELTVLYQHVMGVSLELRAPPKHGPLTHPNNLLATSRTHPPASQKNPCPAPSPA